MLRSILVLFLAGLALGADPPAAIERSRQLLGFGAEVALNFPGGQASVDRMTRIVTLQGTGKEYAASIDMAGGTRPVFSRGKAITLKAELLSGEAVALAACMIDSRGMEFGTGNLALKPGANALVWEVPAKVGYHWGAASDGTIAGEVRITRVVMVRWPNQAVARLRLDGIDVTERVSQSDFVSVELTPNEPLPVVPPGSQGAAFALRSSSNAEVRLNWSLTATTADGTQFSEDKPITVAPKGALTLPLPPALTTRQGLVRLDWKLADAGGERSGQNRLAVMQLAGHDKRFRDIFMFGCGGGADQALRQIGIDVLRVSDNYTHGSADGGVYDWSKNVAEAKHAHELGFELSWLTTYTPRWAAVPGSREGAWSGTRAMRPDAWRAYMKDLLAHVKDYARYYEIWNEADLDGFYTGDVEHYKLLLKIAHDEIKAVDPKLNVLTSGWAVCIGHGGRNLNPDIQRRVIAECQDFFDYHAFHQHGDFFGVFQGAVDGELADIRKTLKSPKPLFYTETSVCSGDDWASQIVQGDELVKKVVFAWARGAYAYEWFTPIDWDERWGLINPWNQAKPAYCTYNTLIRTLRGLAPQRQLDLGKDRWGFVFADPTGKDPRQVVVHWRENDKLPEADFRLAIGAGNAIAVDVWGNAVAEPLVGGEVRIQPRTSPSFLVITGGSAVTTALPLAVPEPAPGVAPGETFRVAVAVGNPAGGERAISLAIRLPEVLQAAPVAGQSVKLAAGASQPLSAAVAVPVSAHLPNQGLLRGTLSYDLAGAWRGELSLPIETVRVIPAGSYEGREPDFILDQKSDVVNFFGADPANADKLWKGPEDLSARIWLARQGADVLLKVDVSDDIYDMPYRGGDSWKGDGLQVAFEVPGQKGWWEIALHRSPDGKSWCHVFAAPAETGLANPWDKVVITTTPRAGGLVYTATLRGADFGFTEALLAQGLRFNMIVNDSDGKGIRESFLRIAEGIGEGKTMNKSPVVRFRQP